MNKKKMMKVAIVTLLLFVSIFIALTIYYTASLKPLEKNGKEKLVEIPSGYGLNSISDLLENSKIIRSSTIFKVRVKLKDVGNQLKAGKYLLSANYSVDEIIDIIAQGKVVNESTAFTIPEGWKLDQIAQELEKQQLVQDKDDFIKEASKIEKYQESYKFLSTIKDAPERTLEGYLFPDTYFIDKEENTQDIVKKMLARFGEVFTEEYINQAKSIDMTIDDIVILSSIVEQETKYDIDRPGVAGVFYNRIDINMPLQSDVTVLYALGVHKEQVLYKDLEVDSRYNTYKYTGLPVGPIGSFGISSLKATLYPEENEYYYFIAKPDGYCVFNKTLGEHNVDVNKYLR
ncbi:endolytic transglycosylase MltG [Alkalibaculum sp. M08DMB]|uniref:Endolytic murein transglycosylase n=1 Tax=Alkalibaculum sporogenes TaxID=2655001 RepID=A0A6A7K9U9_9FIRM|nr:endolytic transglycosylase MltG [Alkalibaculum sporogenes]MPW26309.1 endolytic transglycosylase MltG [Alkalibaculum sporogenes]